MRGIGHGRIGHGRIRRTGIGGLLLILAAACGDDLLLGPEADQGVEGVVLLGPQCPVQSDTDPCPDAPYAASIVVLDRDGDRVTRVEAGLDGRFRVGLKPGRYTLAPVSGNPFPTASDQVVDVSARVWTSVTVQFDTGIR